MMPKPVRLQIERSTIVIWASIATLAIAVLLLVTPLDPRYSRMGLKRLNRYPGVQEARSHWQNSQEALARTRAS